MFIAHAALRAPAHAAPAQAVFGHLHARSEAIYDGDGSWGRKAYGYRMPLRDTAWRAQVYASLARRNGSPQVEVYRQRAEAAVRHLVKVQEAGGTGVFGFPADTAHPEFGTRVQAVMARCAACVRNGWVVALPGADVSELYYDHGHALAVVAEAEEARHDPALRTAVHKAAGWALDKPLTRNINYLSSLAHGLAQAWHATGDARYLEKAVDLHRLGILPHLDASGRARDAHNAKLEYHGFIVSGMASLRRVLPPGHPFTAELDRALAAAVTHMSLRGRHEPGPYGATWPGTNVQAWHELSALRPLAADETAARDRALALIGEALPRVLSERDPFRLRKALYSYFFVGLAG